MRHQYLDTWLVKLDICSCPIAIISILFFGQLLGNRTWLTEPGVEVHTFESHVFMQIKSVQSSIITDNSSIVKYVQMLAGILWNAATIHVTKLRI